MIEYIMFLGIGFLAACLLALAFFPIVHARAVRLTARRHQDAIPASVAESQAEKDHLRASFAMSIRRLEIAFNESKAKIAGHLCEIGKKTKENHILKLELRKAAADHLSELAEKSEENRNLKMELDNLICEIGRQPEGNHGGAKIDKGDSPVLKFEVPKPKRSDVFSFEKQAVKWVACAAASILIVSFLLLELSLIGGDGAYRAAGSAKIPAWELRKGFSPPEAVEAIRKPASQTGAHILIIRGGRRQ